MGAVDNPLNAGQPVKTPAELGRDLIYTHYNEKVKPNYTGRLQHYTREKSKIKDDDLEKQKKQDDLIDQIITPLIKGETPENKENVRAYFKEKAAKPVRDDKDGNPTDGIQRVLTKLKDGVFKSPEEKVKSKEQKLEARKKEAEAKAEHEAKELKEKLLQETPEYKIAAFQKEIEQLNVEKQALFQEVGNIFKRIEVMPYLSHLFLNEWIGKFDGAMLRLEQQLKDKKIDEEQFNDKTNFIKVIITVLRAMKEQKWEELYNVDFNIFADKRIGSFVHMPPVGQDGFVFEQRIVDELGHLAQAFETKEIQEGLEQHKKNITAKNKEIDEKKGMIQEQEQKKIKNPNPAEQKEANIALELAKALEEMQLPQEINPPIQLGQDLANQLQQALNAVQVNPKPNQPEIKQPEENRVVQPQNPPVPQPQAPKQKVEPEVKPGANPVVQPQNPAVQKNPEPKKQEVKPEVKPPVKQNAPEDWEDEFTQQAILASLADAKPAPKANPAPVAPQPKVEPAKKKQEPIIQIPEDDFEEDLGVEEPIDNIPEEEIDEIPEEKEVNLELPKEVKEPLVKVILKKIAAPFIAIGKILTMCALFPVKIFKAIFGNKEKVEA